MFRSPKFGVVAGCMVVDGVVRRNNPIWCYANNVVIFEGALDSLRRFKDDVSEVRAGTERGGCATITISTKVTISKSLSGCRWSAPGGAVERSSDDETLPHLSGG